MQLLFHIIALLIVMLLNVDFTACVTRRQSVAISKSKFNNGTLKISTSPLRSDREVTSRRSDVKKRKEGKDRKIILREISPQLASNKNVLSSYVGKLGQGSLHVAENVCRVTLATVKASVDLLAGKHVSLNEIAGTWSAMQDVVLSDGTTHTTPVSFIIAANKTLVALFNGKEYRTKYTFTERSWPRYCTIEFDAKSYRGPHDRDVVEMTYRAHFKKSILNSRVLLMKGTVLKSFGKLFWRGIKKVGEFRAIKRRYS